MAVVGAEGRRVEKMVVGGRWGCRRKEKQICFRMRKSKTFYKLKTKKLGGLGWVTIQGRERGCGGVPGGEARDHVLGG